MTPVCSINLSATVIPSKSAFRKDSLSLYSNAIFANFLPSAIKSSFFPTKSVSQPSTITTPSVLALLIFATETPSLESLSALFSATFCPFLRRIATASSKFPFASVNAFFTVHHSCSSSIS
jgi:hypothetical protein